MSNQSLFWFRTRYDSGYSEIVVTLDTCLRDAWERQWRGARLREDYADNDKRHGRRKLPRLVAVDVLREPPDLIRLDPKFKKFLDDTLRLANTPD